MTKREQQIIEKIGESTLIKSAKHRERNQVYIKGFIMHEPSFINDNKQVAFTISLIHETKKGLSLQCFKCFSMATRVINALKEMTTVCYVSGFGCLREIFGDTKPMITGLEVLTKTEYPLARKETKNVKKENKND